MCHYNHGIRGDWAVLKVCVLNRGRRVRGFKGVNEFVVLAGKVEMQEYL
jgi:hypothetical protein